MFSLLVQTIVIALLAALSFADVDPVKDLATYNNGFLGQFPSQTFKSSDAVAPVFQINTFEPSLIDSSGFLFLTLKHGDKSGPAIFSSKDLSLVYADIKYERTFDARAQVRYGGKYLTFIEGGRCHAFDATYQKKWSVSVRDLGAVEADIHDFEFTTQGTAILTAYQDVRYNLTVLGGDIDGWLSDSIFQEVDLDTDRVFNTSKNHYLVSSRGLSAIILLHAGTLDPRWILGGKHNQFKDLSGGNATNFANQYNARFVQGNESRLSFFDNQVTENGMCNDDNCSRGVVVELDYDKMTVRLLHEFYHPQRIYSGSGGSVQGLDNGNFLVGWGANPGITEHSPNGTIVMDIQQGVIPHVFDNDPDKDMSVYRAWKMDWIGRPPWGPSIASSAPGEDASNATVYVSWNGDTQVHRWELYEVEDDVNIISTPRLLANSSRSGFETEINLGGLGLPSPGSARAVAVSKSGKILGSTATVDLASGRIHGNRSSVWILTPQPSDEESVDHHPAGKKKEDDEEDAAYQTKPSVSSLFALLLAITFISF
ncbi:unnamed protein product [Fusarium graminearum]|nr:hypothetical protein HG531_011099 [Fusarium graminearum]PCD36960.1 hypothetical protein FGRA07_07964 [Fusarium graminearum]CAF3572486.1 unnamed protein product [Fusarium graminearum]CAG1974146.1 unnamed protein product [Fusarium graminearum]CAG1981180.1 unnamed protein product [Fusarium graminearum]